MAGGGFVDGGLSDRARLYEYRITRYFIFAVVVAALGGSLFGYDLGVSAYPSPPPGPVFRHRPTKVVVKMSEVQGKKKQDTDDLEPKALTVAYLKKEGGKKKGSKSNTRRKKDFIEHLDNVVPQGSLRVDELAKLLA